MWTYSQSTGSMMDPEGVVIGHGYSGNGEGLNNPAMQSVHDVGPLPQGFYVMSELLEDDSVVGEYAIRLQPDPTTEMFGRSGFFCHGDNPSADHTASDGCIVQLRRTRVAMWTSPDHLLLVTE